VRGANAFGAAHLAGSLNVALQGQFASWAGTLVPPGRPVVIVADDADGAAEATLRLARVGVENVAGHLAGGLAAWAASARPVRTLAQITVDELRARLAEGDGLDVLDVRRPGEQAGGHVPGARLLPLDRLGREAASLDPSRPLAVVCAGGYRSSAACSLLEGRGFSRLFNVVGGTAAWTQAGFTLARPGAGQEGSPAVEPPGA
jgi:rhodanese-related sulfurtransferase